MELINLDEKEKELVGLSRFFLLSSDTKIRDGDILTISESPDFILHQSNGIRLGIERLLPCLHTNRLVVIEKV